jgi:hypothetical protein
MANIGDIAIIHYNSDGTDSFSFVFLRPVAAGTTINFTDNGWLAAGGFRTGEGTVTYTAATDIAAGTLVTLSGLDLDEAGDQIIAYEGSPASPTILYVVDLADGNNTVAGDATDANTTALPPGFTLGVNAVALALDNSIYAGPTSGSPAELFAAISNSANWIGSDTIPQIQLPVPFKTQDRPDIDLDADNSTHGGRDYRAEVTSGGPAVKIADTDIDIGDDDGTEITKAEIKVNGAVPGDLLSVNGALPAGITFEPYNPATGILLLTGTASHADYEAALRLVEFSTTDDVGKQKQIEVIVNDGQEWSPEGKAFIKITDAVTDTDPPALDLDANNSNASGADYTATFTGGGPAIPVADTDVSITDPDSTEMIVSATITIGTNRQMEDVLSFTGPAGPITASTYDSATGVLTLTGSATLAEYQTALRQVVFSTTSAFTGDRVIEVTVNDGTFDSNIARTFMHVAAAQNVPPALDLDANNSTTPGANYLTVFTESAPPVPVVIADTDVSIIDSDSPTLASATITLTNPQADDSLTFNGTPPAGITVSGSGTGVITLTGVVSAADYQTALQQILFSNASPNPSNATRVIAIVVNDGASDSNTARAFVQVEAVNNSAPVLDLDPDDSGGSLRTTFRTAFTENGAAVPIADIDTTITDLDSATLVSATITLTNRHPGDSLTAPATLPGGITASAYDPGTGVLTLTGLATLDQYEAALQQISYSNSSDDPVTEDRLIEVVVNDGANDSNVAGAVISVVAVNDPPAISVETTATYIENGTAIPLSPLAIVTDPDDTELEFAAVLIEDGSFPGDGDELTINGATSGSVDGVTFQWDPTQHTLTLFGSAPVAVYQELLRNIEFQSTSDNPTDFNASPSRTLTWVVGDGPRATTTTSTLNIVAVNDAPQVTAAATAAYTENGPPIVVSPASTATDIDDINLVAGGVRIASGALAGDVLTVNGLQSGTFAGIDFSYDAGLHTLVFTRPTSVAEYQTFLQAIEFQSTSDDPTNGGFNPTRTLAWAVFDGDVLSTVQTTIITITALNDAPVAGFDAATVAEGGLVTTVNVLANDSDPDSTLTAASITAFSQGANGTVVYNNDGTFTYTHNGSETTSDSFTYTIDDMAGGTATATVNLTVTPVNDAPVNQVPAQLDSEASVAFVNGFAVSDVDAGSGLLTTTLSVMHGTLVVGSVAGTSVLGSGTGSVTLTGTAAQINATLAAFNNVAYHQAAQFSGNDVLTMHTSDGGNTGAPGPQSDTDTVAIEVTLPVPHGTGHFDEDHSGAYLLRRGDGTFFLEDVNSNQVTGHLVGAVGTEWRFIGTGDFNGNGISDMLTVRDHDNMLHVHTMGSNQVVAAGIIAHVGSEWNILGIGDFNNDGTDDILSRRDGDGMVHIHQINNTQVSGSAFLGQVGSDFDFLWTGDFNNDGTDDLLWQRDSDGMLLIHDIQSNQIVGSAVLGQLASEWHFAGIGDFNGDDTDDLLWQHDDRTLVIHNINNNQVTNASIVETLPADTHGAGIIDFTGDATDDLLQRHDDGTFQFQHIQNSLVTSTVTLGPVGTEWFNI